MGVIDYVTKCMLDGFMEDKAIHENLCGVMGRVIGLRKPGSKPLLGCGKVTKGWWQWLSHVSCTLKTLFG